MTYHPYPDNPRTFLVFHTTGCGEQGGKPVRTHELVYSTDDMQDALDTGRKFFPADPSGWTYDNFTIHINTSTEQGAILLKEFKEEVRARLKYIEEHPEDFDTYALSNGRSITIQYNEAFDGPRRPKHFT